MLEGKHVTLRLFAEGDIDEYLALESRYAETGEFASHMLRSGPGFKKQFAETGFWEENMGRMIVADKEGKLLGTIMFFRDPAYQLGYEIGYAIFRREDRGKGYMTEALRIVCAHLFENRPVPRLQVTTAADNAPARRIAEKCGFQFEGVMRKMGFLHGQFVDCVLYSLLREECPSLAEALTA